METASVSSCREINPAFPCFKILVTSTMTNFNGLELCNMQCVHVEVFKLFATRTSKLMGGTPTTACRQMCTMFPWQSTPSVSPWNSFLSQMYTLLPCSLFTPLKFVLQLSAKKKTIFLAWQQICTRHLLDVCFTAYYYLKCWVTITTAWVLVSNTRTCIWTNITKTENHRMELWTSWDAWAYCPSRSCYRETRTYSNKSN